jgi:hypothetical protein
MCMSLQTRRYTQSSKEEISKNKQFDIPSNEDRNVIILGPRSPLGLLDTRSKTRTLSMFITLMTASKENPCFVLKDAYFVQSLHTRVANHQLLFKGLS